jgi:hypothetical protein
MIVTNLAWYIITNRGFAECRLSHGTRGYADKGDGGRTRFDKYGHAYILISNRKNPVES